MEKTLTQTEALALAQTWGRICNVRISEDRNAMEASWVLADLEKLEILQKATGVTLLKASTMKRFRCVLREEAAA
jgi:hypothetical protein